MTLLDHNRLGLSPDDRMTYEQALDALPIDAEWSCSFGYPGEAGYNAYFRQPDGTRYVLSNGPWDAIKPFRWSVRKAP